MGNESSSVASSGANSPDGSDGKRRSRHRRYTPRINQKRILAEQNRTAESLDSDCLTTTPHSGAAAKAVARKTSQQRQPQSPPQPLPGSLSECPSRAGTPSNHLAVPDFEAALYAETAGRKGSCSNVMVSTLEIPNGNRRRSRSLCAQQMKADCQNVQNNQNGSANGSGSRRSSNGTLPSLARLRIQQCYKHSKANIGQQILKRACANRSEMKVFVAYLSEDRVEELATELHNFITDCVNNIESSETVTEISKQFGRMHVSLCNYGFRPEYFSIIADATIAECVRLDGGAHKRCETLLAWSQLMAFMFSGVRDGYYAEIRQQRRSSLPQHRFLLKQNSSNVSFDLDL